MRTKAAGALILVALGAAGLDGSPARAQSVAEFYKDKSVAMIIGGSPGGGFDTLAAPSPAISASTFRAIHDRAAQHAGRRRTGGHGSPL